MDSRGQYHRPSFSIEIVYGPNNEIHEKDVIKAIKSIRPNAHYQKTKSISDKIRNTFNQSIFSSSAIATLSKSKANRKPSESIREQQFHDLLKENAVLHRKLAKYEQYEMDDNVQTKSKGFKLALALFTVLVCVIFVDYFMSHPLDTFTEFFLSTLSFMGIHLWLEHVLEAWLAHVGIKERIHENSACIRDIVNNGIMVFLFFVSVEYGAWWRPAMWGCYLCDLIILFKYFDAITSAWLGFVFGHHFCVGLFLLILNYTVVEYSMPILIAIVIFITSNTWGVLSVIWITFQWKWHAQSKIITFCMQRVHRASCFVYAFAVIDFEMFYLYPHRYFVLFVFALWMEVFDTYFQLRSIIRYHCKKPQNQINS